MTYVPNSNSVVAFQSDPTKLQVTASVAGAVSIANPQSSIVSIPSGSVAAVIIGGSIAASFTPPANQSVSGIVGASLIGLNNNTGYLATGARAGTVVFSDDVSNTKSRFLGADGTETVMMDYPFVFNGVNWDRVRGNSSIGTLVSTGASSVIVLVQGSIATTSNPAANQSVSGTVTTNQGTNPWVITGSVQASLTPAANQSVSGTVQTDVRGSVATVIIGGSIATTTGNSSVQVLNFPSNQSVSGEVSISNFPTTQNISGSVAAWLQSSNASIITVGGATGNSSVQVLNFPTNQSVSGTVGNTQVGTWITSVVNIVPSSMLVGASIIGLPPVNVTNTNLNVSGSVVAFQGAGWSGSVAAIQKGTWSTSVMTNVITSIATAGQVMGSVAALQATNPWVMTGSVQGSFSVASAVPIFNTPTTTSSVYAVKTSITTISIMAANVARVGGTIYNNSGTNVFVKLGTGATTSIFTVKLSDTNYYELPYGWTGVVAGITASNAGVINVTEISQ